MPPADTSRSAAKSPADEQAVLAAALCRFTAFTSLSDLEIAELMALTDGHREVARGELIVREGSTPPDIFLLIAGWTASSIDFAGGQRQLIKVHLPGDLLGVPSLALRHASDSVVALTNVVIAPIARQQLGRLFERNPRLAAILFLISQEERVVLMDRLASIGATAAINRLAALLLQIRARVARSMPGTGDSFALPLLQSDMADIIGVTPAHLNRTIQRLRADGLLSWRRNIVTVHDAAALVRVAELPPRRLASDLTWLPGSTVGRGREDNN